jgi:hypothetical protein
LTKYTYLSSWEETRKGWRMKAKGWNFVALHPSNFILLTSSF